MGVHALFGDLGKLGIEVALLLVLHGRDLTGKCTAIHGVVLLSQRDGIAALGQLDLGAGGEVRGVGLAQRIHIETAVHTDQTDVALINRLATEIVFMVDALAVADRDDHRIFGLAEGNQDGKFKRLSVESDLDHRRGAILTFAIGANRSVFAFYGYESKSLGLGLELQDLVIDTEFLGGLGSDEGRIIPSQFGNRVGHFLQPTVVDVAAVVNGGIGGENDFK